MVVNLHKKLCEFMSGLIGVLRGYLHSPYPGGVYALSQSIHWWWLHTKEKCVADAPCLRSW